MKLMTWSGRLACRRCHPQPSGTDGALWNWNPAPNILFGCIL